MHISSTDVNRLRQNIEATVTYLREVKERITSKCMLMTLILFAGFAMARNTRGLALVTSASFLLWLLVGATTVTGNAGERKWKRQSYPSRTLSKLYFKSPNNAFCYVEGGLIWDIATIIYAEYSCVYIMISLFTVRLRVWVAWAATSVTIILCWCGIVIIINFQTLNVSQSSQRRKKKS